MNFFNKLLLFQVYIFSFFQSQKTDSLGQKKKKTDSRNEGSTNKNKKGETTQQNNCNFCNNTSNNYWNDTNNAVYYYKTMESGPYLIILFLNRGIYFTLKLQTTRVEDEIQWLDSKPWLANHIFKSLALAPNVIGGPNLTMHTQHLQLRSNIFSKTDGPLDLTPSCTHNTFATPVKNLPQKLEVRQ